MNYTIETYQTMLATSKKTAFVLSGGGARGALQIGALQALHEAGIEPRLLVGASIGAIHSAYLAINGFNERSLISLRELWHAVSIHDPLSTNPLRLVFSLLPDNENTAAYHHIKTYLIECGISPDVRFADIHDIDLMLVATDLSTGSPTVFSTTDPAFRQQSVLDAVLASACLMPWMQPIRRDGRQLADGGIVSELPLEPAISYGADHIYALDLAVHPSKVNSGKGLKGLIDQVIAISQYRQKTMELSLASLQGANVRIIELGNNETFSHTDFHSAHTLLDKGYQIARQSMVDWHITVQP